MKDLLKKCDIKVTPWNTPEYIAGLKRAQEICRIEMEVLTLQYGEDSQEFRWASQSCLNIVQLIEDDIIMEDS